jgi:hypothetical protein
MCGVAGERRRRCRWQARGCQVVDRPLLVFQAYDELFTPGPKLIHTVTNYLNTLGKRSKAAFATPINSLRRSVFPINLS